MNDQRPAPPRRPSRADLLRIYNETSTIAVVGASTRPGRAAHDIPAYLHAHGYRILPVNPRGGELFGEEVHQSLAEIHQAVDVVDVFRPPEEGPEIAHEAARIGAKVVWFQPGTQSAEATAVAIDAGLVAVTRYCMGALHGALGLGPGPGHHEDG